ncbi:MAG: type II toxin-antitoxin system RelE/ParE family toxin [Candidatus Hydrogenedentota bacterium]
MTYKILYHHRVKEKDFSHLDLHTKKKIIDTIEERLSIEPEKYGKPLRKPLARHWKLRIGKYRVVYKIMKDEIWILAVIHRNNVYGTVLRRIF